MRLRYLIVLALSSLCLAQGVRFGDGQPTIQAGPVAGKTNVLRALPNAIVSICAATPNAVPCTNKVVTYTDSTLAVACSTSTQLVLAGTTSCVGTTDSLGNWGVWLPAGQYSYTVTVGGTSTGPFNFSLATGNGGSNGVNTSVTGTTYTFLATDSGRNVIAQNIGPMTFTLPAANTMGQAFEVYVQNVGLSAVTIVAPTNTIDANSGSVGVIIPVGMGLAVGVDQNSNSPNYWTKRGIGFTGSFTGATNFIGNMVITGNLSVSGTITQTGTGAWQFSGKSQTVNSVTVPAGSDFSEFIGLDNVSHCQLSVALGGGSCAPFPATTVLAAAYTNATTSFTNVTGLTGWTLLANTSYKVDCDLIFQTANSGAAPKFQVTGPASPTNAYISAIIGSGAAAGTYLVSATSGFAQPIDDATVTNINTNFPIHLAILISNGANAGAIQLQAAAHTAFTMTIQPTSACTLNRQ